MVVATKVTGKVANSMEREFMSLVKAQRNTENGKMGRESAGLEKMLAPQTSDSKFISTCFPQ